ncbi:efflux RND transporter permease subunit, partial [Enterobacter hormaechei]
DAAREGASRRFRAVMMTAVSFIIGVLPMILATRAGAHSRPIIGTTVLMGMLVGTLVGKLLITALFLLFHPLRDLGHRHNEKSPKSKTSSSPHKKAIPQTR